MSARNLQSGVQLSLSAIANAWGCARETAKKRLDTAGVKPAGKNRGHNVYELRDVVRAFAEAAQSDQDPDKLDPFARHAYYKGEHEKLRLQQERGELLSRIEVEDSVARERKVVAHHLDTFPDRLERSGLADPRQIQLWEDELDRMRRDLYRAVVAEAERDADSTLDASG